MKQNYQKMLGETIAKNQREERVPSLLLHSCCAPCSSYCLEYLSQYFKITVLYYNPNIYPESEYRYRAEEQKRFISLLPVKHPISFVEGDYIPKEKRGSKGTYNSVSIDIVAQNFEQVETLYKELAKVEGVKMVI